VHIGEDVFNGRSPTLDSLTECLGKQSNCEVDYGIVIYRWRIGLALFMAYEIK